MYMAHDKGSTSLCALWRPFARTPYTNATSVPATPATCPPRHGSRDILTQRTIDGASDADAVASAPRLGVLFQYARADKQAHFLTYPGPRDAGAPSDFPVATVGPRRQASTAGTAHRAAEKRRTGQNSFCFVHAGIRAARTLLRLTDRVSSRYAVCWSVRHPSAITSFRPSVRSLAVFAQAYVVFGRFGRAAAARMMQGRDRLA